MGKANFSIALSFEIAQELFKEQNKSALIESLLFKHYGKKPTAADIQAKITTLTAEKNFLEEQEQKEKLVREQADEAGREEFQHLQKEKWQKHFKDICGKELTAEQYEIFYREHYEEGIDFKGFITLHSNFFE